MDNMTRVEVDQSYITFDEWWRNFLSRNYLSDNFVILEKLRSKFEECWERGYEQGFDDADYSHNLKLG